MLTPLDSYKLNRYKSAFGEMTSAEALELATSDDQIARDLSPFDIAKSRFQRSAGELFEYAILLEKEDMNKKG